MNAVRLTTLASLFQRQVATALARQGYAQAEAEAIARNRTQSMEAALSERGAEGVSLAFCLRRTMASLDIAPTREALDRYLAGGDDYHAADNRAAV